MLWFPPGHRFEECQGWCRWLQVLSMSKGNWRRANEGRAMFEEERGKKAAIGWSTFCRCQEVNTVKYLQAAAHLIKRLSSCLIWHFLSFTANAHLWKGSCTIRGGSYSITACDGVKKSWILKVPLKSSRSRCSAGVCLHQSCQRAASSPANEKSPSSGVLLLVCATWLLQVRPLVRSLLLLFDG